MKSTITFYGGAGTVTGANFLLETGTKKLLIDCGSREREHICDPVNFEAFAYSPASVDALFVTHAHQDHIGRIPKLVRDGFRGEIHSTAATKDLAAIMFDDAISIMHGEAMHQGCPVLYEKADADRALSLWNTHEYHQQFDVGDTAAEFLDAGHILGSAMVRLKRGGKSIIFTGDLGNTPEPLLRDSESTAGADYLVIESVYGDRLHENREGRQDMLKNAVIDARNRKSTLLIPSFSIERTQILLYELNNMVERKGMEPIHVYLDAPLAIKVTAVYRTYQALLNPEVREHFARGDDPFVFKNLKLTPRVEESDAIHKAANPKIIIAGAGMGAGGRIRSHFTYYGPDPHTTILFVGYQAPGSLGRRILDGEKKVNIDGVQVRMRAQVAAITGYSGHADRDQLLQCIEKTGHSLKKVFVAMGEPRSSLYLAQRAHDFLGVEALVPQKGESHGIEF